MKVFIVLLISGLIEVAQSESCNVPPTAPNLALFGKICQSSTYDATPRPSAKCAVDGIAETNHTRFPCSMTTLEMEPWITLDMGSTYACGFVSVVNRQDGMWKYLKGTQIQIGDSPDRDNPICANITKVSQSQPNMQFFCHGMMGQYVTLIQKGKPGILSVCEMMVYQHVPAGGGDNGW